MRTLAGEGRWRSFWQFVLAVLFYLAADIVAHSAGRGLAGQFVDSPWAEWLNADLVYRALLLFLLIAGFGYMGRVFTRQPKPLAAMGLARRPGWGREIALGLAFGWALILVTVIGTALAGNGLRVSLWTTQRAWVLLATNLMLLAVAAWVEEVAFRGYPFQRLIGAVGPFMATLLLSAIFAFVHLGNPDASGVSTLITFLEGVLLSIAYLRTKALWLPWGLHFGWNVSMGVLFGLPLSGVTRFASVVQGRMTGPGWATGGFYGPEASTIMLLALIAAIIPLFKVTKDYAWKYNQPVIVAGGIPMDMSANEAQSAALMAAVHKPAVEMPVVTTAEGTKLVQIQPIASPVVVPAEPPAGNQSVSE